MMRVSASFSAKPQHTDLPSPTSKSFVDKRGASPGGPITSPSAGTPGYSPNSKHLVMLTPEEVKAREAAIKAADKLLLTEAQRMALGEGGGPSMGQPPLRGGHTACYGTHALTACYGTHALTACYGTHALTACYGTPVLVRP